MINFFINTETKDTDKGMLKIHTVTDAEGYPINQGHFTDVSDAECVRDLMQTDKYHGDSVSDLSKAMDSWIMC